MKNEAVPNEVAQEYELHQLIVDSLDQLPVQMKETPELDVLAWAHELRIHDSGRQSHADGYADLLTVDELGRTWIVEVKLATSSELNARVWEQLVRYRNGLQSMHWRSIHQYLDRFLDGKGTVKPFSAKFREQSGLPQVLAVWQSMLHRTLLAPDSIVGRIASALGSGTAGLAVISDAYSSSVVSGAKALAHSGPVAYLAVQPTDDGLLYELKYFRSGADTPASVVEISAGDSLFPQYAAKRNARLSTSNFANGLHPRVRPLWDDIVLPALLRLGWDGTAHQAERKGIAVPIPCRGRMVPLIRIAYCDADAANVDRQFKLPGTYGLRIDVPAMYVKQSKFLDRPSVEDLARRLRPFGWRGTGVARDIGSRPLTASEYREWGGYLRYHPSDSEKDFLGRKGEAETLGAFFDEIARFCEERPSLPVDSLRPTVPNP